jgi:glycine hydroxymethyltransferase
VASENIISPSARLALSSDLNGRYTSHGHYVDYQRLEEEVSAVFARVIGAKFCTVRPLSGTVANMLAFLTLARQGDRIMALKETDGGHKTFQQGGLAGALGLRFNPMPFRAQEMTVDLDRLKTEAKRVRPRLIIIGTSLVLFQPQVREIVSIALDENARVMYDGAHEFGLILSGELDNPMRDGVDIMTASTHKSFPGPQGGLVFTQKYGESLILLLQNVFANHHPNRIPGLAIALQEMLEFGKEYTRQAVANARTLAESLHTKGINVLCEKLGFTETHQIAVDVSGEGGSAIAVKRLAKAGILCKGIRLPIDEKSGGKSGLRLGTAELTRLGMKASEMSEVARLMVSALQTTDPAAVRREVLSLKREYGKIHYSVDEGMDAYALPLPRSGRD